MLPESPLAGKEVAYPSQKTKVAREEDLCRMAEALKIAAVAALVRAAGGIVIRLDGRDPVFNSPNPLLNGLMAFTAASDKHILPYLKNREDGLALGGADPLECAM